jgi:hypothetical protein
MTPVIICGATMGLTCTTVVASAEAHSHPRPRRCAPGHMPILHEREEGARLLLANEHAEVYVTYVRGAEGGQELEMRGCVYGQRSHKVGDALGGSGSGGGGTSRFVLGGTTVAGENSSYCTVCDNFTEAHSIFAIDLRTGAKLGEARSPAGAQSIVVKPDGAFAWIAASNINGETGFHEEWVYAHDHAGTRLLAHGSDIDYWSLARAKSTVYWTQGGQPFSATLE